MIAVDAKLMVFVVLAGIVMMELTKHAIAYFWRMLTKTDKYITRQDLKPLIHELMTTFMKDWCSRCDSKKDAQDISAIKRILIKLAIKAGISEDEIAELTQ